MNHIDGHVNCSNALGLMFDDQLVAVATTRRPRHDKWRDHTEIARLAFASKMRVVGGVSRLINAIRKRHGRLMSYVDTRLGGDGRAYVHAGMKLSHTTVPRFWWTDMEQRFDRFSVRADATRCMTQTQVAHERGVSRIWGTCNLVFVDV